MLVKANHLWDRYRKGDKLAFEQIYFKHVNLLYDYGIRISRNVPLVEDCIQDLFSDLWEKRLQMNTVHSVKSYLLVSIRRRIIRRLSSERENAFQNQQEIYNYAQDFDPDLSESIAEEKLLHLSKAFAKLSDKQKEVIYLRFYSQLSYEEIADVMSVQVKAIYKLMARAIHSLRTHISIPILELFLFAIIAT
ncbi:RNA polymerase sigma factor [Catalinimonas niigatensis]|uniref:RNA polymerase sigma factor n=1 Tax=Catalinimonas niigatensis TaxID=1397264 RepID=UPI0026668694|nr:sigma-70 family RNA polymerase sigma factor [Catalinimonas niigatensis]WPP51730.1 sigma-70 family RNA polymerase sigma factor [Catalinimonas niigatensis]